MVLQAQANALLKIQAGPTPLPPVEAAKGSAGKPDAPKDEKPKPPVGDLVLVGMKHAEMGSPELVVVVSKKDMVMVAEETLFMAGYKGVTVAFSGEAIVKGKEVHLNPPSAPAESDEPNQHESAKPEASEHAPSPAHSIGGDPSLPLEEHEKGSSDVATPNPNAPQEGKPSHEAALTAAIGDIGKALTELLAPEGKPSGKSPREPKKLTGLIDPEDESGKTPEKRKELTGLIDPEVDESGKPLEKRGKDVTGRFGFGDESERRSLAAQKFKRLNHVSESLEDAFVEAPANNLLDPSLQAGLPRQAGRICVHPVGKGGCMDDQELVKDDVELKPILSTVQRMQPLPGQEEIHRKAANEGDPVVITVRLIDPATGKLADKPSRIFYTHTH